MMQSTSYILKKYHKLLLLVLGSITCCSLSAFEQKKEALSIEMQTCYLDQINSSKQERSVGEIENWCNEQVKLGRYQGLEVDDDQISPLAKRLQRELANKDNPNVITSHKRNYLLPISYIDHPNSKPYEDLPSGTSLDNFEAKFQLSFKAPISESILQEQDMLFFGFTIQSYWQMYNSDMSSPFRETNYQPEIFYGFINDFDIGDWTNVVNIIGFEHQSNGRPQPLSRSWNRLYAQFVWENDNWITMFKPWYRIPEERKTEINQPDGDDNPDIDKYMGYFEFTSAYKWDGQTFGIMFRNNLRSNNKGAIKLDWTFPMGKRFKGYAQYFNGYGESLIDYNHSLQRIGVGILLTDVF
jgi:phospholipase A1/A2